MTKRTGRMRDLWNPASHALLLVGLMLVGSGAQAADADAGVAWELEADLSGKFVGNAKSTSSFRQDHNIKSGGDLRVDGQLTWDDDRTLALRGFGQSGEEQGYFVADYSKLGQYGLLVDFSSWREYYNARTGRLPETAAGEDLADFFPGSNDGRDFFAGGSPATDWMTGGLQLDYKPRAFSLSDIHGDFKLRRVDGDQTLLKSGAIFTEAANQLYAGGTGLIDFAFPSQKDVDYLSYLASAGTESSLGRVNWQIDYAFGQHDFEAETREANFLFDPNGTPDPTLPPGTPSQEVEYYREDTELQSHKLDIAVARHLSPNFYLFGAGVFSYLRSDPEPAQDVGGPGFRLTTRETESSKVERLAPMVSVGSVFQPVSAVLVRLDGSFKYVNQEGEIDERRNEAPVPGIIGDPIGNFVSQVERDSYLGRARLSVDGRLFARARASFDANYRYRREIVDSLRTISIPGRDPEIEDFTSDRHRFEAGPSFKYRFRRGRNLELGYRFLHENYEIDIDELSEQFVLEDYDVMRHRAYVNARGRVMDKLRGDLRIEYIHERRDMDQPSVDPDIFDDPGGTALGAPDSGEIERESWAITPSLYYTPGPDWSFSASASVRQLKIDLVDAGPQPDGDRLADFEYDALTGSLTAGVNYRPGDDWSANASYSVFASEDSVDNQGHHVRLGGDWRFDDTWRFYGNYGFYLYRRDGTGIDDYDAHVVSAGVRATF